MLTATLREQLTKQINTLPDDVIHQIADFTFFVMSRRGIPSLYDDWDGQKWQNFALEQFFRESDDVEYSLDDAREVYRP